MTHSLVALWVAACTLQSPTPPAPAPEAPAPAPAPEAPAPAPPGPEGPVPPADRDVAAFAYEGWVGEGKPVVTATRAIELPMTRPPGGMAVGSCALARGETLRWDRSLVQTDRVGVVPITEEQPLPPDSASYGRVRRLTRERQYGETKPAPASLRPGDQVEHLAYRAEGLCFYRVGEDVISTACFHEPDQSAQTSWWLETTCGGQEGWVRVDGVDGIEVSRTF